MGLVGVENDWNKGSGVEMWTAEERVRRRL